MKFSTSVIFLASMASAAAMSVSNKVSTKAKLLRAARRVEGENNGEDMSYLANYSLKMISCDSEATITDADSGETEYSAVLFRLCPTTNGCDSESVKGCGAGHGDFIVGMNTFVNAFFEDQRDNMSWDDQFKVDEYAECRQYQQEKGGNNNNNNNNQNGENQAYWVGPTCLNKNDIALAVFEDETCSTKSETSFETISNGWTLPYEEGGLISITCLDCVQYNDNGESGIREMCQQVYQSTAYKCETSMEFYSYYGKNEEGCEATAALMPVTAKSGNGGKVFGWIVFIMVVAGLVGYVMWWRKKKAAGAADGIMS